MAPNLDDVPRSRSIRARRPSARLARTFGRALPLAGLALAACGHAQLVPIGRTASAGAALARGGGIVLLAAPGWPHSDEVAAGTTPIFVTVMNEGPGAVDLGYRDFTLVDDAGKVLQAIPPLDLLQEIYGTHPGPPAAGGGDGFFEPLRGLALGDVEEGWGRELPEGEASPEAEPYWPRDYRRILDHGLHAGRIEVGKRRDGYVFFQPAWTAHEVTLHLRTSRGTGPTQDLSVSFRVEQ